MLLLEPTSGSIYINGEKVDFTDNSGIRSKWMNSIGHVPQEIFLIDDTVKKNIMFDFGSSDLTDDVAQDRVVSAARFARVDDVIMDLPFKYESVVGERGTFLSGGQRQRLGIARAIFKSTRFLIFDEATSALDETTENEVINNLFNNQNHSTYIMVAHRLNTLRNCNKFFLLENGSLREVGLDNHD